jgi:hypothetical protein
MLALTLVAIVTIAAIPVAIDLILRGPHSCDA